MDRRIGCVPAWLLLLASVASPAASRPRAEPYVYAHRAVTTQVTAAQAAFDRGLTLVYAYQPDEAEQAFRQAARLDPGCAMAFWGVALALGPNINVEPTAKNTTAAAKAIRHARRLAAQRATPAERDYIEALAARYSDAAEPDFDALALAYRDRMHALVARYPNDPDAAALFAEAIMDLRPWRLWTPAGEPVAGTPELLAVLESGLLAHPDHPGLLHFYIHAVEGSREPGRALAGARRLAALPVEPAAAHLVHMPAHTFLRVGDWQAAIDANEHAVHHAMGFRRSTDPDVEHVCSHCLHFLAYAYGMQGNAADARRVANEARELDGEPWELIATLSRFGAWQELLDVAEPAAAPAADGSDPHLVRALWHYGRGLAGLGTGAADRAAAELELLRAEVALMPPAPTFSDQPDLAHVLDKLAAAEEATMAAIAERVLAARLAVATGRPADAVALLREAVAIQSGAEYTEPPPWYYPVRETLALVLYREGATAEAEAVLRECLTLTPNDPRALMALRQVLDETGRQTAARALDAEIAAARRHADRPLAWDPF
jgi:tetratricopeptide (TPR) repeat protein